MENPHGGPKESPTERALTREPPTRAPKREAPRSVPLDPPPPTPKKRKSNWASPLIVPRLLALRLPCGAQVEDKIRSLEDKFNTAVAQKEELAAKVADATVKNDRAGRLLGGLGGEKIRWKETVERLTVEEVGGPQRDPNEPQ